MIVEPKHFEYLVVQHGSVSNERKDFSKWKAAYELSLETIYNHIAPVLPNDCAALLDIGSGLGGIDVLLANHYSDSPAVRLLDGENDPPVVRQSFEPFNNMKVAEDFLWKNGVKDFGYYTPGRLALKEGEKKFDLVVSFAAYGFHIHPGNYLEDLMKVIHKNTVVVLDVRRSKDVWLGLLVNELGSPRVLHRAEKYVRVAFRA